MTSALANPHCAAITSTPSVDSWVTLDGDAWVQTRELVADLPVGRGPAVVEQARLREEKRAAAHRSDAPHPPRRAAEPADERTVADCRGDTRTARDDEGVDPTRRLARPPVRHEADARGGDERPGAARQDLDRVGGRAGAEKTRRLREDLERPGDIEELEVGIGDDRDPPRAPSSPARRASPTGERQDSGARHRLTRRTTGSAPA